MASGPITSWQIDGETVELVADFILGGSKGNGTPLQYSCLENPMDGGAWWAAVYGVTQSQTRLKGLSSSSSSKITADANCSNKIERCLLLGRKVMINIDSILKSRDITLSTKVHLGKAMVFPVVMYRCELDHKQGWVSKNWCFWTVLFKSSLDCKEIKPVNPKGDQSWIFTGRTNAESEAPILWPPDVKSWLTGKDPEAGKDWGQEEKGATEDETAERHYWLN